MPRGERPTARARRLRAATTEPERRLRSILRAHRLGGVKFVRQLPVGPYIVDFAARSHRLAIEVDGDTHSGRADYDARRTVFLEGRGYTVIRFTNAETMANIDGVADVVLAALRAVPSPNSLPNGEGA